MMTATTRMFRHADDLGSRTSGRAAGLGGVSATLFTFLLAALSCLKANAQTVTGPQQLAFAGLRSAANQGSFNAVKTDAAGNLFLLLDEKDGVRILKTDPAAATLLAQTLLGAAGDVGLSLAVDPVGDVYVAGTTTSTSLAGTAGAAFAARTGSTTNSFVAKYDNNLNNVFVTFAGSGGLAATSVAATADAVFLTGSLFGATLPVTAGALQTTPASGSSQDGFVERFSTDGSTLVYATYLTGTGGDSAPAAIVADASDYAYIAGYTSATGFPTQAALVPVMQAPAANGGPASGFLTKLTPAGDALVFSTFIPGAGVTSLALDGAANNLLLTGSIALGAFPVANAQAPLVATQYQVMARMPLDGSNVISSTVLAPGGQSFVTPGAGGTAWVDGVLSVPLLPAVALEDTGTSFAAHVTASGGVDQTARFGGLAATNQANASAAVTLTSVATDAAGQPFVAGVFMPTASSTLLATERYDLSLGNASAAVLPSAVTDAALPGGSCSGSLCAGSAGYLAKLTTGNAAPSLVFSVGAAPDVMLRNLGSADATGVQVSATGFTVATSCGQTLAAGGECSIALSGAGPGTVTAQASNATTETVAVPAVTGAATAIVFSPRELDFGIQTMTSAPVLRTVTVTNLSQQTQSFTSAIEALNTTKGVTPPFTETGSDCATGMLATTKILAAGATCHITLGLALASTTADGPLQNLWKIAVSGTHDVLLTGYANGAALSVSAGEIDFGTQFAGGLTSARFLYLTNNSDSAVQHAAVSVAAGSAFTVTDRCPATLGPRSVCQIQFGYGSATSPSVDAVTLTLDQGLSVVVMGRTLPQPVGPVGTTNASLTVTPAAVSFANAVAVTSQSTTTQTVSVANTGSAAFPLGISVTGDFTDATSCGAMLGAHQTCSVVLTFAPTGPGTRTGLLTVTTSTGTNPVYVNLTGTATAILADSNGNTLGATPTVAFGGLSVGQPATIWLKVTQPFQSLSAAATGAFGVILVEDLGFGHGNPAPAAFQASTTGACTNCYLGVQFEPTTTGAQTATLSLTSGSFTNAYVVTLTGAGLPTTGLLVTPATQDFGMVPVNSGSQAMVFSLTNLLTTNGAVTVMQPGVTGDFALSSAATGGAACSGTLAAAATCLVEVVFAPTAVGARTGTLTFQTSGGTVTAALTGTGVADPGVSLVPDALTFQAVPGPGQQTVTIGNTGVGNVVVGAITSTNSAFTPTSTCGMLAPTATCTVSVVYAAGSAQASGTLQIPVTAGQTLTTYTVALTGAYTSSTAGLQIVPAQTDFGPTAVDTVGPTRTFTINNLTAQQQTLTMTMPRQFALTTLNPCPTLAANASCTFNVTALPVTTSNTTGTIYAQGLAPDGVTTTNGLAYLAGYGANAAGSVLRLTGNLSPGTGFFDFGQVASGQSYTQTLTVNNASSSGQTLSIRRVTAQPPFLSTTTCGATLAAAQSCTVTVTYSPLNQVATGSASSPAVRNTGTLTIESDDAASPTIVDLTGSAAPTAVASPSNVSPIASYTVSNGSLTFPNTAVGNVSAVQMVTVTNTGTVTLHVGALTTTPDFAVTGNGCAQPVVAGAACTLSIAFTPTALGMRTATLQMASDSGASLDFITLLGVSSPSSLLIAPQTLSFGSFLVGSTAMQPVQITNNGLVPVTISSIAATGDYSATSNCPASLAAGAGCTVQVVFAPTAPGTRAGTLSVTSTASTLPLTVSLNGTGLQSHLTVNPALAAFGNVGVGSSLNLSLTLSNTGTAPLSSLALAITGDYSIATPCATATLAPAQTCQVTLTFTPSTAGARGGTLTVTSTDATSPITVALTGTGIQSHLQIAPTTLAFGAVAVGSSGMLTITLSNTGTATISGLTPSIAGDYSIATPCSATMLAPNATCTLTIVFAPTATGLRSGTLTLTDSDPASPTTIPLTGTGTTTPSHLQITPGALSFGSVTVGSAANLAVTLSNTGTTAIAAVALAITGDYAITTPCPATLAAAQSCTVNVTFTPTAAGVRTGTLTITSSDPSSPAPVALSGTGTAVVVQPHLQVSPPALAFGTVTLGTTSVLSVTVSNPGSASITGIALTATGDYTVSSTCGTTLAAGQSCVATVTFAPTVLGARTGTLAIASSDPASPALVPLTGSATAATSHLQITPATPNFGSVFLGSSSTLAITLANTGLAAINSIALAATGDYTLTTTCGTTLAAAQTCVVNVTFTPSAVGVRAGALIVTSSDPSSPLGFALTGSGAAAAVVPGSFTLTVNGGATASATVASGSTATYTLTATPTGGFTGPVVLNCTPLTSATYSSCAMLPSTLTLAGAAQNSTLTITTLTSLASPTTVSSRLLPRALLALVAPGCLLFLRRRRVRRAIPLLLAWTLFYVVALGVTGCGGGPNLTLRYVTPGTYQYQVTASSTATVPITQTVAVTVVITNN